MNSFGAWLRPTILGPLITMWVFATLGSVLVGAAALTNGLVDNWLTAMIFASFFGSAIVVMLITADLVLLRAKLRSLPTGSRAWTSSSLAPLGIFFLWRFFPAPETAIGLVIFLLVPMALASFGLRYLFGQRP
jgi:hypothetical protein